MKKGSCALQNDLGKMTSLFDILSHCFLEQSVTFNVGEVIALLRNVWLTFFSAPVFPDKVAP